jgi:uncharacterized membrane protein
MVPAGSLRPDQRRSKMIRFFRKLMTYLIYGFVFWLPVTLVIYIAVLLFSNAENIGKMLLGVVVPDKYLFTGLGIVLCILIIFLSGVLLKSTKAGAIMSKIPLLGLFFGQGEIITISRLLNMQPCLFLLSPTCISYGWILSEEKVQVGEGKVDFPLMSIYYPNVPTLVTGSVFAIRKDTIIKLGNPSREVINLLLYAFRSPACLKYVPWEGESAEVFSERSKVFGLK